jgi:hypothetical protein
VADFFCGSGTTAAAAVQGSRRFIAADGAWRAVHTTYTRLAGLGAPFAFYRERHTAPEIEAFNSPMIVTREGRSIRLADCLLDELDAWEFDPAWDGGAYISAAQASRPLRKGALAPTLSLPVGTHGPICVRTVTVRGERGLVLLPQD